MKRTPTTLASAAAASLVLLLTGCGAASEAEEPAASSASANAPAGLLKSGEVSFCTDPEYPPMEYYADGASGDPIGFDSDAAVALAELWGLEAKFVPMAFDGLMPGLQAQRCDILWSALYMSPERLEVAAGQPYLKTGPGLIVAADTGDIANADDLAGKTVAVQGGGANEQTLKDLSAGFEAAGKPGITVQPYPKASETVAAVRNGKADALIETDVAAFDMVSKSEGSLKSVPGIFEAETEFGVFTLPDSPLTAAVKEGVKDLEANGTLTALATKYGLDPELIHTGE